MMAVWTPTGYPSGGDAADYADSVASSYDGSVLIGQAGTQDAISSFYIHVSKDYGQTWHKVLGPGAKQWGDFALSASGTVAYTFEQGGGHPWVSVDSGDTWTELTGLPAYGWSSICCSADGATAYLGDANGLCYKTTDYGETWAETSNTVSAIESIACSSNGNLILASSGPYTDRYLHVSEDGGASWSLSKSQVGGKVSMSGSGQVMASYFDSHVWVSTDGGETWTDTYVGFSASHMIYVSANGLTILVSGDSGTHYSYDGGVTWGVDRASAPLFLAADKNTGTKLVGVKRQQWRTYSGLLPSGPNFFISDVSPSSGPLAGGTLVTITGGGFYPLQQDEGIWFGGVPAGAGTFVDETTYTVVSPSGEEAGDVAVSIVNAEDPAEYSPFTYTPLNPGTAKTWSYTLAIFHKGRTTAGTLVALHVLAQSVTFAVDLQGSQARARVGATETTVFSIMREGEEVATCTFAAGQSVGVYSAAAGFTVSPGQFLSLTAPLTVDSTLEDIAFTIVGVEKKVRNPVVGLIL